MPMLRCTNEDCEHSWFEQSSLAVGSTCDHCGSETDVVDPDDELFDDESPAVTEPTARLGHARQLARQALLKHGIADPPVDVFAIAAAEGFEVRIKQLPQELSGHLDGDVIEVNANEAGVRQRFTVAHELGHHALGTTHGFAGGLAQKAIEREAHAFAGELLVPGAMLRAQGTTDAGSLRRLFGVSRQALQIAADHHRFTLTGEV